jgi:hypothetical protein
LLPDYLSEGSFLLGLLSFEDLFNGEGRKFVARALIKLVLEFNPVEPKGVQKGLHQVHHHQHANSEGHESEEPKE